jgi:protein gp37
MKTTQIEWAEATWNITSGCTRVSEGCRNCYAERLVATRLRHLPQNEGVTEDGHWTGKINLHESKLLEPLRRRKPTRYFVCSQSDLFHPGVPFEFTDRAFAVMALCPQHTFMVLTKRPERMEEYLVSRAGTMLIGEQRSRMAWLKYGALIVSRREGWIERFEQANAMPALPYANVWLGTSVENQAAADARIPHLLRCPAAVRFLSVEPMLGPVEFSDVTHRSDCVRVLGKPAMHGIHWVIAGGESGPNARPMHPDWARSLRDQCQVASVPFYFKQWGEWAPHWTDNVVHDDQFGKLMRFLISSSTDKSEVGKHVWHAYPKERIVCSEKYPDKFSRFEEMRRVGKKAAGHLLDGRQWHEFPEGKA